MNYVTIFLMRETQKEKLKKQMAMLKVLGFGLWKSLTVKLQDETVGEWLSKSL